jgi:hypothetical protein
MKHALIIFTALAMFSAVQAAETITPQENAACKPDAIRYCFFSLGSGEATRACLRAKLNVLQPKCSALIKSRLN